MKKGIYDYFEDALGESEELHDCNGGSDTNYWYKLMPKEIVISPLLIQHLPPQKIEALLQLVKQGNYTIVGFGGRDTADRN